MKKEKPWSRLDHAARLVRIETLWNEGRSDQEIAKALSATKGQIVGYRHTHLPGVTAATRGQNAVKPEPPKELRMRSPKQSRVVENEAGKASPGFSGKLTSDWQKQCGHLGEDNRQCGYHFTVDNGREKRCDLHAHEIT